MADQGGSEGTELGRSLAAARNATDPRLRQIDVVARTGLSQARLSRVEKGQAIPTENDVDELVALYELDADRAEHVRRLAADARAGIRDSRLVVQRGNTQRLQQRWRRIEDQSRVIRSYHPALVIGALQTQAYAAVVLERDVAAVQDRGLRRARLDRPDRSHILIQTEGALRAHVGSSEVMAEQWEALRRVSTLPNVHLGVIPAVHPVDVVVGTGFHIYDDTAVAVGIEVASATLTDPADVRHFRARFEQLAAMAVFGDDARRVLESIARG